MSEKLKRENKSELSKSQRRKLKKLEVCASVHFQRPDLDLCQLNFDSLVFMCAGGEGKGSTPIKKH